FSVTLCDARGLAACTIENGDGAAVLRPARVGVANCDRTFVAVGDGAHTVGRHAAGSEEVAGGGCTALAESEVVCTRAAFVGMAFDRDRVLRVTLQPLGLLGKRLLRIGADQRRIEIEEDAVADIDREVLSGTRRRGTCTETQITGIVREVLLGCATGNGERHEKGDSDRATCNRLDTAHGPELLKI